MNHLKIKGTGYHVPKRHVTNQDLEERVDTTDEWIQTRTGIQARYMSEAETTTELAYEAARKALANANMQAEEIDLIIVATLTPDNFTPSCACLVQEKLGLNQAKVMAFDLNAACSGFLYALNVASSLLATKQHACALVIGSEVLSKLLNWEDRTTYVLFGDGAGALILKAEENKKQMLFHCGSKGDHEGILKADSIAPHRAMEGQIAKEHYIKMDGTEVFRFAVDAMQKSIETILKQADKTLDDIDLIIPHQANLRIIKNVSKRCNIDWSKFYINLDQYGNTSAASIAIALAELYEKEMLKEGMKILLVGFGAGFTWAASYIEL